MNTTIHSDAINISAQGVEAGTQTLSTFWERLENKRFGFAPMILVAVVCVSGFAAAVAVNESVLKLAIVSLSTTLVEGLVLAVMPMRTITIASIVSVILSALIIAF